MTFTHKHRNREGELLCPQPRYVLSGLSSPAYCGERTSGRQPLGSISGKSLIDVLATLSIIAVLTAITLPLWNPNRLNILTARRIVVANLRLARANAITKSLHYRVSFTSDMLHVTLSGMYENPVGSGTWAVDSTKVQTTTLPRSTQVSSSSVGITVEFNTHGMVANTTALTQLSVTDSFGNTKSLQLWPSGQIHEI